MPIDMYFTVLTKYLIKAFKNQQNHNCIKTSQ